MKLRKPLGWIACLILPLLATAAHAVSLSPSSLLLPVGKTGTITLSSISEPVTITSSDPGVATAVRSSTTKVTVTAGAPGSATLTIRDRKGAKTAVVTVKPAMTATPVTLELAVGQSKTLQIANAIGTVTVSSAPTGQVSTSRSGSTVTVKGLAAGTPTVTIRDSYTTVAVPVTVTAPVAAEPHPGRLLASNCFQCHGTNGSGGFERLRGETAASLLEELREFAAEAAAALGNPTDIMAAHVAGYTDEQLQLIADFLSKQ